MAKVHVIGLRNCVEDAWIRHIVLPALGECEFAEADPGAYEWDASSGAQPLLAYCDAGYGGAVNHDVREWISRMRGAGAKPAILHMSDEYAAADVALYADAAAVFRLGYGDRPETARNNVVRVPLGPARGLGLDILAPRKASARKSAWCFLGRPHVADRKQMLDAFASESTLAKRRILMFTTSFADSVTRSDRSHASAIMHGSVFVPCCRGNRHVDTFRLFEALEHGCIPLAHPALGDYLRAMHGHNPVPVFSTWEAAAAFAAALMEQGEALDSLQGEIAAWYAHVKQKTRDDVDGAAAAWLGSAWPPLAA